MFIEIYLPVSRPYFKPNPFYEKLKKKEKEVMLLLHNLRMENPDMTENLQELKKEMNFYRSVLVRKDATCAMAMSVCLFWIGESAALVASPWLFNHQCDVGPWILFSVT